MAQYAIGIDLGGTNVKAALVERGEGLVTALRVPTEAARGAASVIERIVGIVREMTSSAPAGRVLGVGIGAPGTIDWDRTSVTDPPNIPGWGTVDLCAILQREIQADLPVIVENDANVAALGSSFFGAGRAYDSFIMVTLGTGVGGAIIYQNRIFRGTTGGSGEIGHMTIDYEGPPARSGVAGAIEAYLGQEFLTNHARFRLINHPESTLHTSAGPGLAALSPALIHEAAVGGDEAAREIMAWAGHKLGVVLGAAVNLLDIRTIIVGGGVSAAGDFILEPARETIRRYIKPGLREGVEILQETLGNEVGILGAASLVFEHLDTHALSAEQSQ